MCLIFFCCLQGNALSRKLFHWDGACLFVPMYSDRWSGKCGKLYVRTDMQGTMVSAGWVVNTGNAFGLMKLENMKWLYSSIPALETYFGCHCIWSKELCLEKQRSFRLPSLHRLGIVLWITSVIARLWWMLKKNCTFISDCSVCVFWQYSWD